MATRAQNLQRIRTLLDTPQPSRPDFNTLFQLELSTEADILNTTSNSGQPWAVNVFQLNYTPGLDSYNITADGFGKPILVTRVLPGPYITRLPVDFADLTHLQYGTVWQMWSQWGWGMTSAPERMSFFREGVLDAQVAVKIEPAPIESAVYEITYIPAYTGEQDPLESVIQLPEMATLVQLRVAAAALPYAAWYEDEAQNRARRAELAQSFEYQLSTKEPIFRDYVRNITRPKDVILDSAWGAFG